jgi:hypothetical protein
MTAPAGGGGGELGTVFINVAPSIQGISDKFIAAGRQAAKDLTIGLQQGMKESPTPSDGSILGEAIAGKPVSSATRAAAQKAGKEIGTGLTTGVAEGMKTAPTPTGGGVLSDVIAGKPVSAATRTAAENLGKDVGANLSKGIGDATKDVGKRFSSALAGALTSGDISGAMDGFSTKIGGIADVAKNVGVDITAWVPSLSGAETGADEFSSTVKGAADNVTGITSMFEGMPGKIGKAAGAVGEFALVLQAALDISIQILDKLDKVSFIHDRFMNPDGTPKSDWDKLADQYLPDWLNPNLLDPNYRKTPPPAPFMGTGGGPSGINEPIPYPSNFQGPIPPGASRTGPPILPTPANIYQQWYGGGGDESGPAEPRAPREPAMPRSFRAPRAPGVGTPSSRQGLAASGSRVANLYALADALQGTPYSTSLRDDCSGMVAQLAAVAVGLPPPSAGERFSTVTEQDWLLSHGFRMGMGPPGSLRIGWTPLPGMEGHTAATLPGGEHAESGGSGGGFRVGGGAAGAEDPQFSMHAYLPMRGGAGPGGPLGTRGDPLYTTDAAPAGAGGAGGVPGAQEFGGDLISGMFQELGLPDVFGKPFTQWGLWKTGMGALKFGLGLAQAMGGAGAGGSPGAGPSAPAGLAGMLTAQQPGQGGPNGAGKGAFGDLYISNDFRGGVGQVEKSAMQNITDGMAAASGNTAMTGGAQGNAP